MKLESLEDLKVGDKLIKLTYENRYLASISTSVYEIIRVNKNDYTISPECNGKNKVLKEIQRNKQSEHCSFTKMFGIENDFLIIRFNKAYIEFIKYTDEIYQSALKLEKKKEAEEKKKEVEKKAEQRIKDIKEMVSNFIRNKFDKDIIQEAVDLYLSNTHKQGRLGGYYWE